MAQERVSERMMIAGGDVRASVLKHQTGEPDSAPHFENPAGIIAAPDLVHVREHREGIEHRLEFVAQDLSTGTNNSPWSTR